MVVNWTEKALSDFVSILEYIEQDNPDRAKSFAAELQKKINNLAEFPSMGRPGCVMGTRELVVHENYVIPYRVQGSAVMVLSVRHAARRLPKRY